jgi:hypothetical protein
MDDKGIKPLGKTDIESEYIARSGAMLRKGRERKV